MIQLRECPECGGDGRFTEFLGPGVEYGFGYVPRELVIMCDRCDGTGEIECLVTSEPEVVSD